MKVGECSLWANVPSLDPSALKSIVAARLREEQFSSNPAFAIYSDAVLVGYMGVREE